MDAIQVIKEPGNKCRVSLPIDYLNHEISAMLLDSGYISAANEDLFHETNNAKLLLLYRTKEQAEEVAAKLAVITGLPVWTTY